MNTRANLTMAIIGFKEQGKSPFLMKLLQTYDMRNARILIICPTRPKSYEALPVIQNLETLGTRKWRGIFLYVPAEPTKMWLKKIDKLSTDGVFKGGAIAFDDCDRYFDRQVPEDLKACVLNHKNNGWDAFLITHSLIDYPSFLRRNTNTITLFKTADEFRSVNDLLNFRYPNSDGLYNAWLDLRKAAKIPGYIQKHHTIKTGV